MHSAVVDSSSEHSSMSPVFPCRQLTSQQSAVTVPVASSRDTNLSNSASPWLSKERGISNKKMVAHSGYKLLLFVFFNDVIINEPLFCKPDFAS